MFELAWKILCSILVSSPNTTALFCLQSWVASQASELLPKISSNCLHFIFSLHSSLLFEVGWKMAEKSLSGQVQQKKASGWAARDTCGVLSPFDFYRRFSSLNLCLSLINEWWFFMWRDLALYAGQRERKM